MRLMGMGGYGTIPTLPSLCLTYLSIDRQYKRFYVCIYADAVSMRCFIVARLSPVRATYPTSATKSEPTCL